MAHDFGSRTGNRRTPILIAIGACGGAALAFGVYDWLVDRTEQIAIAARWTLAGQPCPTLNAAQYRAYVSQLRQVDEFDGVTWARIHGDVVCHDVRYNGGKGWGVYPVCQFNHPGVVNVATPHGDTRYFPGAGRPATISLQHGVPRCVIAANADFMNLR